MNTPKIRQARQHLLLALQRIDSASDITGTTQAALSAPLYRAMALLTEAAEAEEPQTDTGESRWCELSPEDQTAAFNTAHEKLIQTADPQFIPLPANFLSAKSWTRSAPPRTLPVEQIDKPKKSKRAEEREALIRQAVEDIKR